MEKKILYICAERLSGNLTGGKIENIGDILELSKVSKVDVLTPYDIKNLPNVLLKNTNIRFLRNYKINKNLFKRLFTPVSNDYLSDIDYSKYDKVILSCFRTFYYLFNNKIRKRKNLIIKSHGSIFKWNISNFSWKQIVSFKYVIKNITKIILYSAVEIIVPIFVSEIWYMTSSEDNLIAKILNKPKKFNKLGSKVYFEEISKYIEKNKSTNISSSCFIIGDWNISHNTTALVEFFKSSHINRFEQILIVGNMDETIKQNLNLFNYQHVNILGYLEDITKFQTGSYTWVGCADGGSGVPIKLVEACEFADRIICTSYCHSLMRSEKLNKRNIPVEVF